MYFYSRSLKITRIFNIKINQFYHENTLHFPRCYNSRRVFARRKVWLCSSVTCSNFLINDYSTKQHNETIFDVKKKADIFKNVLEQKKEQLRDKEQKIRQKGEELVRDIKFQKCQTEKKIREKKDVIFQEIVDTKSKVKEKIEDIVLRENIYTIPNVLCVARIMLSPVLGMCVVQGDFNMAIALTAVAGVTDLLDGWIARRWRGQASVAGSFLDPLADKVLLGTLFVALAWRGLVPLPLAALVLARDAALVGAALVVRFRSLPPPRTLRRYLDVTHATAQLAPTALSKLNTAMQLLLVGGALYAGAADCSDAGWLQALCVATALSTVAGGLSYVFSRHTFTYLKGSAKR